MSLRLLCFENSGSYWEICISPLERKQSFCCQLVTCCHTFLNEMRSWPEPSFSSPLLPKLGKTKSTRQRRPANTIASFYDIPSQTSKEPRLRAHYPFPDHIFAPRSRFPAENIYSLACLSWLHWTSTLSRSLYRSLFRELFIEPHGVYVPPLSSRPPLFPQNYPSHRLNLDLKVPHLNNKKSRHERQYLQRSEVASPSINTFRRSGSFLTS